MLPTPKPILVRPEWQRLSMQEVKGQKRRTRSDLFPSTTANLVDSVLRLPVQRGR